MVQMHHPERETGREHGADEDYDGANALEQFAAFCVHEVR
jgi:hypothetical protein